MFTSAARSRAGPTNGSRARSATSTATFRRPAARHWWSPTTTSPAPSRSCARSKTKATRPAPTPAQIGRTWLNYAIERRTIFWWGGVGHSTEHTAYARLKQGIPAPDSGSRARNGKVLSEQIGAQIFIDGWAMVAPGDPERAADLARRAASVSHDGEAIYGAQVIAAMEAHAFVESDIDALIDAGSRVIPRDSTIARLIHDVRAWHAAEPRLALEPGKNRRQIRPRHSTPATSTWCRTTA